MLGTMRLLLCLGLAVLIYGQQGDACVQFDIPSVKLRAAALRGAITLNGKPIEGALLSLHKYLGSYSPETEHFEAHSLRRAKTEKDGKFTFGEVPPGKYVILMSNPSAEATQVELLPARAGAEDTVAIQFFADFCQRAFAVSADGRPVDASSPRILGMRGQT